MDTTKTQLNVPVPTETKAKLAVLAKQQDRSLNSLVRRVLAEAVKGVKVPSPAN